ncbi:helix-turn-helix transcriptional regulator [Streptomyces phaeofaciens JCM 4814]|uniref:Transcriptional regulator n=1 Tax=Streptomyces phaeofaciens TaxID=68254 RepID=A0A918LZP1_9ACTN|nr:helix-turn-helix transcriptional regulator [Streptomyces phaeofaciens]GGT80384.1 transcriptional regulator [Streptomyces phaeofaciens]
MSDNELGLFLRLRREAVTPAEVGLPTGPRRRTPGLRRAELATLAGVSVEYVTRLEQGRDRRPSAQVLAALADALLLSPGERVHLHRLVKGADPGFSCRGGAGPNRSVRPTVRALLEGLEPAPAVLVNRLSEILACTDGYRRLAEPLGLLDGARPSLARFVFTDPRARSVYPDWNTVADEQVAALKQGPGQADVHVGALMDELTVSSGEPFAGRLRTLPGLPRANGVVRMVHPEAGEMRLAYETLDLPTDDDQQLVVHLPADDASAAVLDRLTGRRPGALRAV